MTSRFVWVMLAQSPMVREKRDAGEVMGESKKSGMIGDAC